MDCRLTCIVVNRNTARLLVDCLVHIYASHLPDPPQVIVIDNGSTDDSVERVKRTYPDVRVIEAGRNLGFAAANDRAAKEAHGRFLLLVNTDAMLQPDCAARLLQLMEDDSSLGMVGPQLLNADGTAQTSYEAVPTLATETLNRSLLKRLFPQRFPHRSRVLTGPTEVEALIGAVMLLRREAFDALGGFDEDYFFFLEETDLAVRMRAGGWKVVHEPGARAAHLQGGTAKTYQAAARIEFYRSRYLFFRKHYGTVAHAILKAALVANLTLNVAVLGAATAITLAKIPSIHDTFRLRKDLWLWHVMGCPASEGLPRT